MSGIAAFARASGARSTASAGLLGVTCAVVAGWAAAVAPGPALLVGLVGAMMLAVALHPPLAAYILLVSTPLLVGIDRGQALPVLRPSEAVALVVAGALGLRLVALLWTGRAADVALHPTRIDAAIIALALSASVIPMTWMLIRGREITHDDILYALVLWKFYAIFLIVRLSIRTERQVHRCLWIVLLTSAVVAVIGILQALGVGGVIAFLNKFYSPQGAGALTSGRASSTMGSSFSVADVMTSCVAITAALIIRGDRHRWLLSGMGILFVLATLASGEFSAVIGLTVAGFTLGILVRRFGQTLLASAAAAAAAIVVLQPVIEARLQNIDPHTGLPSSWLDRVDNLRTFFLPQLTSDFNWMTGVRPTSQLPNPRNVLGFVWIESGHVWLLWTGGIAMVAAFVVFIWVAIRTFGRIGRTRSDAIGVAAVAGCTSVVVMAVLMTFDPHLTLRGAADLNFSLLALALTGCIAQRSRAPAGSGSQPAHW